MAAKESGKMKMTETGGPRVGPSDGELVITRVFDAPRELVWKAWTEPEHFEKWWGPKDFTAPVVKIDLRVGGKYLYCMRSPGGQDYWGTGVYRKIVGPELLVMTDSFADESGNVVPATYYGMSAEFPLELQVTVTFEEHEGKTKMTLRHVGIPAGEMKEQTSAGWNGSFDKLAEHLANVRAATTFTLSSDREIIMTRIFDAPRQLVFKAHTDPVLIAQWWGPRRFTTIVDRIDVRPGGAWRFINRTADGEEYGFRGEFREIVPPERIVWTFEFEGMPGHVSVETATFEERDGKTRLTARAVYETVEDRDGMLSSGMEEGARETWDRLAELLEKMKRV